MVKGKTCKTRNFKKRTFARILESVIDVYDRRETTEIREQFSSLHRAALFLNCMPEDNPFFLRFMLSVNYYKPLKIAQFSEEQIWLSVVVELLEKEPQSGDLSVGNHMHFVDKQD